MQIGEKTGKVIEVEPIEVPQPVTEPVTEPQEEKELPVEPTRQAT